MAPSRLRPLLDALGAIRRRKRLVLGLKIAAIAITLGFCIYGVQAEWSTAGPLLEQADAAYIAFAFLAVAVYYLTFIVGWIRILAAWRIRVPYGAALQDGRSLDRPELLGRVAQADLPGHLL